MEKFAYIMIKENLSESNKTCARPSCFCIYNNKSDRTYFHTTDHHNTRDQMEIVFFSFEEEAPPIDADYISMRIFYDVVLFGYSNEKTTRVLEKPLHRDEVRFSSSLKNQN